MGAEPEDRESEFSSDALREFRDESGSLPERPSGESISEGEEVETTPPEEHEQSESSIFLGL